MFRYKFNKEERTFHITSDEGDSFYVKNKIPQMGDFQDDKIDEYGNFFCKLFSEYCLKSDGDTSFVVYKVFIDLHFYHNLGCGFLTVWSDNMAQDERKRIGQQIKEVIKNPHSAICITIPSEGEEGNVDLKITPLSVQTEE